MGALDYPGTVFGIGDTNQPLPDLARRYARGLALHHYDHILPTEQHPELLAAGDAGATAHPTNDRDRPRQRPQTVESDRL